MLLIQGYFQGAAIDINMSFSVYYFCRTILIHHPSSIFHKTYLFHFLRIWSISCTQTVIDTVY
jgi:hypothetical protein